MMELMPAVFQQYNTWGDVNPDFPCGRAHHSSSMTSSYPILIIYSHTTRVKHKIAMTIEAEIVRWVDSEARKGRFRNRSHGFEYCARIVRDREIA